jgi:hypothetical protein
MGKLHRIGKPAIYISSIENHEIFFEDNKLTSSISYFNNKVIHSVIMHREGIINLPNVNTYTDITIITECDSVDIEYYNKITNLIVDRLHPSIYLNKYCIGLLKAPIDLDCHAFNGMYDYIGRNIVNENGEIIIKPAFTWIQGYGVCHKY